MNYELFPRTLKNIRYLCTKCNCSTKDLEKALFILEEQNRIKRVLEGFEEFYKVVDNKIKMGELGVDIHEIVNPDTLAHLVITKTQRIREQYEKIPEDNWVKVSSETGRDSQGPTKMDIYYEANQNTVKIIKQGVNKKGDPYIFYKFSRR